MNIRDIPEMYSDLPNVYTKQISLTNEEYHSLRLACFITISNHSDCLSDLARKNLLNFLDGDYDKPDSDDYFCCEDCGVCNYYQPENGGCQNSRFD